MGTLINVIAILLATAFGLIFKKGLSEKIQNNIMFVLGLGLMVVSIGWFMSDFLIIEDGIIRTSKDLLVILSLVIGVIIGETIDIDARLNRFAYGVESKYKLPPLAKGFIAGTLIFCVGAMAIIGSLNDGIHGDSTTLIVKSALDFVTAMVLTSVFGVGVAFSAISVLIYQGSITLLASAVAPLMTEDLITGISLVGSVLLVAMGLNFMNVTKVKVANLLPALAVPVVYQLGVWLWHLL
ncbi:MAG: DUF554 domain-containing protein [Acholeplasmataceae bacterium]|nr:DUF554 domain-containing protein [Acholeplasmataceae bacterium]